MEWNAKKAFDGPGNCSPFSAARGVVPPITIHQSPSTNHQSPSTIHHSLLPPPPLRLLFVCSRNQWRSPTAEKICGGRPGCEARSAGTEPSARVRLNAGHLQWADVIFCMERRHVQRLRERFGDALAGKRLICLDIPDDYGFMDPELVELLTAALAEYLP